MAIINHNQKEIDLAIRENLHGRLGNIYLTLQGNAPVRIYHVRTKARQLQVQALNTGKWIPVSDKDTIFTGVPPLDHGKNIRNGIQLTNGRLPICSHGSHLQDGSGEPLEPPCGCRLTSGKRNLALDIAQGQNTGK